MNIFKNSRFAVSLIFAINGMVFGTWASRIPAIVDFHDLSPGSLGLLIFIAGLSAVIAFSIFGRAADRYGAAFITKRATILLIPLTLIFIGFANSIEMLIFAVIFFGAIHGGDDVAMNAWAAEVERENTRPVMSSFHAMWSLKRKRIDASCYCCHPRISGKNYIDLFGKRIDSFLFTF